eukprot:tig00021357_g20787.t1
MFVAPGNAPQRSRDRCPATWRAPIDSGHARAVAGRLLAAQWLGGNARLIRPGRIGLHASSSAPPARRFEVTAFGEASFDERALRRFQIFIPKPPVVEELEAVGEPEEVLRLEEMYEEQEEAFEDSFNDAEEISEMIPMELLPAVPKSASEFALANLQSPSNARMPDGLQSAISTYLLLAVGIKGGIALATRADDLSALAVPMAAAVGIGVVKALWSFGVSRRVIGLDEPNASSMATHFGGSSAVTFFQAQAYMALSGVPTEGYLALALHIIGMPGIITGLFLHAALSEAEDGSKKSVGGAVADVFRSGALLLSLGGIAIGALWGPASPYYAAVEPFLTKPFDGLLAIFLLNLGVTAGDRSREFFALGPKLVTFACAAPLLNAVLGVVVAKEVGLSLGGAAMFGALAAGASYIAAPAAVRAAIPEANASLGTSCALAVTFPFNVIVGVPFCLAFSQWLYGSSGAS